MADPRDETPQDPAIGAGTGPGQPGTPGRDAGGPDAGAAPATGDPTGAPVPSAGAAAPEGRDPAAAAEDWAEATPLDLAHAAMEAAPEDDALRLAYFARLADTPLFLLLAAEPEGEGVTPEVFTVEGNRFALVFDREDRLAAFVGGPAPYAGLSGRGLARLLAGQGIGLAVNPDVAPSANLLGAEAVDWLVETLAHAPQQAFARPREIRPPGGLPQALLAALDAKLAQAGGLAEAAWLAGVTYDDGTRGHLLAFAGARPGAEAALAAAAGEALTFSGIEAGAMDVAFIGPDDPLGPRLARVGLRFDLPRPEPRPPGPAAPGMDPDRPPRLR